MSEIFHGFELLLFKKLQTNPEQWNEFKCLLLQEKGDKEQGVEAFSYDYLLRNIPQSLWFLSVALHNRPKYILQLIQEELQRHAQRRLRRAGESLLMMYLNSHQFTEFHLDSIFKYGDDNKLPKEIFKCPNVRVLSLKYNCLDSLPADIGRMEKLQYLALTNNKLQVQSIPYTLTFCKKLRTILLDNNILDALPGFLLQMPSIKTVHRHGNHNYFKSTFMWYHTDVEYRIIPITGTVCNLPNFLRTLQFWAAKAIIGLKKDFYHDPSIAVILQEFISDIYSKFRVCHYCNNACLMHQSGFKVITFKNPYLGNTCVPFQHWACSIACAKALEVPARLEQIAAARRLDDMYEDYVEECQIMFDSVQRSKGLCSCLQTETVHERRSARHSNSNDGIESTNSHRCVVS